jgi:hypothetical protein
VEIEAFFVLYGVCDISAMFRLGYILVNVRIAKLVIKLVARFVGITTP